MIAAIITIFGLCIFEIVTSVDNAIVNASVLKTVGKRYRQLFLFWGILFAVFVVRGVLPFIIIWVANSDLGIAEVFKIAFSSSNTMEEHLRTSAPLLLIGGGMYLVMVFLSWLFLENKSYAFFLERFITRQAAWFYALSSVIFTVIIWISLKENPYMALSASIGTSMFFIADGFKKTADESEKRLEKPNMSDLSKIIYLEVLDASFSIDGVIGAFAFTMTVPFILIGNGIGAFVVREVTIRWIDKISKFAFLKNGAMYSIGLLGTLMIFESFGVHAPFYLAPLCTFTILAIFLFLSRNR